MTDDNQPSQDSTFNRRAFLRTSGAVSGIAALGVQSVSASTDVVNELRFVETGLTHDITVQNSTAAPGGNVTSAIKSLDASISDDFEVEWLHVDERREYRIDHEARELHVLSSARERTIDALLNGDTIVRTPNNSVHVSDSADSVTIGADSSVAVPIQLGDRLQVMKALQLNRAQRLAGAELDLGATVALRGVTNAADFETDPETTAVSDLSSAPTEVTPGSLRQITLPSVQTEVRASSTTGSRVRRGVSVPVKPEINVRNHGRLEVLDYR